MGRNTTAGSAEVRGRCSQAPLAAAIRFSVQQHAWIAKGQIMYDLLPPCRIL